jgi:hypothetical protein
VHDADDAVHVCLVDRHLCETPDGDNLSNAGNRLVCLNARDVDARHHDLSNLGLLEFQDISQNLGLGLP